MTAHKAPLGRERGDALHASSEPFVARAGIHSQGPADRPRRAHGKLEPRERAAERLLHSSGKRHAGAEHEARFLLVVAHAAEVASKHDDRRVDALVGDEQIRAPADDVPFLAHSLAGVEHARERAYRVDAREIACRPADTVGGMTRHGLEWVDFPVEALVDEQRLERRGVTCDHELLPRTSVRRAERFDKLRADRRDIARAHRDDQIARLCEGDHMGHDVEAARNIARRGMSAMVEYDV